MSWRDNLLEASFRGVKFYVKSSEFSCGRNTIIDELTPVDKDTEHRSYVQDNGAMPDQFRITGYVIANYDNKFEYFKERDLLIEALKKFDKEQSGGQLIHPFYGTKQVNVVGQVKITETFDEGGIATFDMLFAEKVGIDPVKTADYGTQVNDKSDKTRDQAGTTFTENFESGKPLSSYSADTLKTCLQEINSNIQDIINIPTDVINTAMSEIAAYIAIVDQIIDLPATIITTMQQTVDKIGDLVAYGIETIEGATLGLYTYLTGQSALTVIENTMGIQNSDFGYIPAEQTENVYAIENLYKALLLAEAVDIGINTNFVSQEEMSSFAETLTDLIDDFLLLLGARDNTDALYQVIEDMRGVYMKNLFDRITGLKKEIDYEVPATVKPALVLAYEKYEDIDREQEIIDRNIYKIIHPGFLPSGEILKVLDS